MVVWSQYLSNVADFMNTTTTEAGIMSALIVTIGILITSMIATRGQGAVTVIPVSTFFSVLLFTFMGWFPVWTGSVIALVLVIFMGYTFGKMWGS